MTGRAGRMDLVRLVRAGDYRRFLAIQLATPQERPALYAITAFAREMARIPQKVKEPLAGFMRYAWWREALEEVQQGKPARQHPILEAVTALQPVPYPALFALIRAGQEMLEAPGDVAGMEAATDAAWASVAGESSRAQAALALVPAWKQPGVRIIWRLFVFSLRKP